MSSYNEFINRIALRLLNHVSVLSKLMNLQLIMKTCFKGLTDTTDMLVDVFSHITSNSVTLTNLTA